jgi:uncharacterized membrane protein YphA (DoxX/SURF4 family)
MRVLTTIAIWLLSGLLAFGFGFAGINKFRGQGMVRAFRHWGYPDGFVYVIGALEMLLAAGLLIPRVAPYAAGGLMVIMLGATGTHLAHGESNWKVTVLLLALLTLLVLGRRWARAKSAK